jgi:hypothetical protein
MALADPLSITVGGGAKSFARIDSGRRSGTYFHDTGVSEEKYKVLVSHTEGRRTRSVFRIDHQILVNDWQDGDRSNLVSESLYLVLDKPLAGFVAADATDLYTGLTGLLEASSSAVLGKWVNGES